MIYARYLIHAEKCLILRDEGVLGLGEDPHEHLLRERVERNNYREPADKLRDHSKLNEVPRLHQADETVLLHLVLLGVLSVMEGLEVTLCRCPSALSVMRRIKAEKLNKQIRQ